MKRLFSVLMVAAIATFTFAFTTPNVNDVTFSYIAAGEWEQSPASGCGGSDEFCAVSFSDEYEDYSDLVTDQVELETGNGAQQVTINIPGEGPTNVDVFIQRKP